MIKNGRIAGEIRIFRQRHAFLSNFFIERDGTHVEGEFQASKCADECDKQRFAGLSPWDAKKLGRTVKLRKGWDADRLAVMHSLVKKKFTDHADLEAKLLATDTTKLYEGNTWGDLFWGVDLISGEGKNHLGQILMTVRQELRLAALLSSGSKV